MSTSKFVYQFESELETIKAAIANMTEVQARQVFQKAIREQFPSKGMSMMAKKKFIGDANRGHWLYGIICMALVETKIPNRQFIELLVSDYDATNGTIRSVEISAELNEKVQAYLEKRDSDAPYLFLTVRNKALSERGMQNMTRHVAKKAGYGAAVTPRMLVR